MTSDLIAILAMASPGAGAGQQPAGNPLAMPVMLVIMVGIFYFMLIRPQQRKEKERRAMIENVKTGERVLFGGGIIGTVTNVKDNIFVVKIADNVKIEVVRSAVSRVLDKGEKLGKDDA